LVIDELVKGSRIAVDVKSGGAEPGIKAVHKNIDKVRSRGMLVTRGS
jgi:hypothetical protein